MESIVSEAKELREQSINFRRDSRDAGIEDMEFELGGEHCWDPKVWKQRGNRPKVTLNNVSTKKHRLANDLRDLNPEIKIVPTKTQWEKQAELRNSKLKEIQDRSCAEGIYDACFCQGLASGFSFMHVDLEFVHPETFDQQIVLKNINNNMSVHYDTDTRNPSYIDMKWGMIEGKIRKSLFTEKYGNKSMGNWSSDAFLDDTIGEYVYTCKYYKIKEIPKRLLKLSDGRQGLIEGYSDNEKIKQYLDFEIEGQKVWQVIDERQSFKPVLQWYLLNGDDILEEETEALGSFIPIIPYEGRSIWIRGKQYLISFIRNLKEPSRLKNYGKSTEVELVALQPLNTISAPMEAIKAYMDYYTNANAKAYPVLPYDHKDESGDIMPPPKREVYQGPSNQLQGLFQSYDKDLLDISGMPDDSLGSPSQMRLPGAIELKNNQGNHNNFDFIDNFITRTLRYAGIVMNDLITYVHDTEEEWELEKDGQKEMIPINQDGGIDITEGQYRVTTMVGSASASERKEAAEILTNLLDKIPGMQNAAHIIVKNMDSIKDKDELVKILKAQLPPEIQQAIGTDEQTAVVENMQLKQQLQQLQGEYEQAAELIKSMQIDYKKAMDVQKLKSETDLEKTEMNNATTLTKADMEINGKTLQQLLAGMNELRKQVSAFTENNNQGPPTPMNEREQNV